MPNYAGIADFVMPLADAMRQYREGNPTGAQAMIKQINSLLEAYETQQRASYQSAQAQRTQMLARKEALMTPYEIESERKLGFQREQAGEYSKERAITEAEVRPYDVRLAEEKPKTEQERQKLYGAQTRLAESKIGTPAELQNIVINTPELKAILGEKESYTKAEIDTGLKVLRQNALNTKDAKMVDYYDSRIAYTNKLGQVAEARIANLKAGGTEKPLTPYMQFRKYKNDEILRLVKDEGYTVIQAINAVEGNLDANDLRLFIKDIDDNLKYNYDLTPEDKAELAQERQYYIDLQKRLIKPFAERKLTGARAGVIPSLNYDEWSSESNDAKARYLLDRKNEGITKIRVVQNGKLIDEYNLGADGKWTGQRKALPIIPAQSPKPAEATKTEEKQGNTFRNVGKKKQWTAEDDKEMKMLP